MLTVRYESAPVSKYPIETEGIVRSPGARGISTYSKVLLPERPFPDGWIASVTSGGKTSKSRGKSRTGSGITRTLPRPETRTVSVTAWFASTESRSIAAMMASDPTTPLNGSGRPAGSGSTSIVTGFESTETGTDLVPKNELSAESGSRASLRRLVRTSASMPSASIVRSPAPVGTSATRRITAVAYCWPLRSRCSTSGCATCPRSSTQKPSCSGTEVRL